MTDVQRQSKIRNFIYDRLNVFRCFRKIFQVNCDLVFHTIFDYLFEGSYLLGQDEATNDSPIHKKMDIQ